MSSHREAPGISMDPVADSTDVYAFVSADTPTMVTILANYVPLQDPSGGPNYFEFGDDVLYEIHIDNTGSGTPSISYQFRFTTTITNPNTFLYNTGPISSLTDSNWNRRQTYTVTKIDQSGNPTVLASNLPCPPCNIGPRSTPSYSRLSAAAVNRLSSGEIIFAGQRAEGFYVDLGAIFDLADLRPFQNLHLISTAAAAGVNQLASKNVHTIAIQLPISMVTSDNSTPTNPALPTAVIGVWTTASRQTVRMIAPGTGTATEVGPFTQVSRLGNPLVNEVVVPMSKKDYWNSQAPAGDSQFVAKVLTPELGVLLPILYPGVFPNLAAYTKPRNDLAAIFLTGIPSGIIPGFQNFGGGKVQADELRLNVAIPPAATPNNFGLLGPDLQGWPNGRRPMDDVVSIALKAVAGATIPLVDSTYTPDAAAAKLTEGLGPEPTAFQSSFPLPGRSPRRLRQPGSHASSELAVANDTARRVPPTAVGGGAALCGHRSWPRATGCSVTGHRRRYRGAPALCR